MNIYSKYQRYILSYVLYFIQQVVFTEEEPLVHWVVLFQISTMPVIASRVELEAGSRYLPTRQIITTAICEHMEWAELLEHQDLFCKSIACWITH